MALLIWLGLAACAGSRGLSPVDPHTGQPTLDFWLEDTLIPYLAQQFDQHPRFRGQPLLLVRMRGENVLPRIDDLTEQIRQKIADALLKKTGLSLAWRPSTHPWQHHRSLEELACTEYDHVRYYIGIDTGLSGVKGQLHVKVRALNLAEQKWVSGFGKSWQGTPTAEQLKAIAREHPDEYLRGLRPLPFSDDQPDMLAAYLARNLSCILRQGQADDLVVHVAGPAANTPGMFRTALDLVGKYLTRFREVEVTDDPNQANVTVISAVHFIDQNLHQVWISARRREGQKYLPGAETEAYVALNAQKETVVAGKNAVIPSPPAPPFQHAATASPIISSFELLTPSNQKFCASDRPWQSGEQRLESREALRTGSCLAVEMDFETAAYIFLVGQDARGELSTLYPSDCPSLHKKVSLRQPGEVFQFPSLSDPRAGALALGGAVGTERIYAIAITTPGLAGMFADRLQGVRGLCRAGRKYPDMLAAPSLRQPHERIQRWQTYLTWLSVNHPGLIEWSEISFRHAEL